MGQITLTLKDETIATLRKDFDAFLRVSLKLDPQFATPSFEDFLRAKLLDGCCKAASTHGRNARWTRNSRTSSRF
jgi:hypothetical protein